MTLVPDVLSPLIVKMTSYQLSGQLTMINAQLAMEELANITGLSSEAVFLHSEGRINYKKTYEDVCGGSHTYYMSIKIRRVLEYLKNCKLFTNFVIAGLSMT